MKLQSCGLPAQIKPGYSRLLTMAASKPPPRSQAPSLWSVWLPAQVLPTRTTCFASAALAHRASAVSPPADRRERRSTTLPAPWRALFTKAFHAVVHFCRPSSTCRHRAQAVLAINQVNSSLNFIFGRHEIFGLEGGDIFCLHPNNLIRPLLSADQSSGAGSSSSNASRTTGSRFVVRPGELGVLGE